MKVLDPGHRYELGLLDYDSYDAPPPPHELIFVKREGQGYPGNMGHYPGTTLQEVLRALIDRCDYVNKQIPSGWTQACKAHLESAIYCLEVRAAERHGRKLDMNISEVAYALTCPKCGHVGCQGGCHS